MSLYFVVNCLSQTNTLAKSQIQTICQGSVRSHGIINTQLTLPLHILYTHDSNTKIGANYHVKHAKGAPCHNNPNIVATKIRIRGMRVGIDWDNV